MPLRQGEVSDTITKYFDEIEVGERNVTLCRTITEADIFRRNGRKDPEAAQRLKRLSTFAGNPRPSMEETKKEQETGLVHFHVVGSYSTQGMERTFAWVE
jgi:hypothetical protein